MKKIFTLAIAVLASFSLWAVEPTFESYDWQSKEAAEAVAGDHDGIVISYAGLNDPGNVSGHWYIPVNTNLKNSDNPWTYFGIAANAQIDSVAFLYCPNGSNATSIAWAAWGKDVTPNQYVLGHGVTAGTTGSKAWDKAVWETIDLSEIEAYTVYMSRSIREFREIGGSSNIPNFGGGQTINILGVRVWLNNGVAPVTYTVTYKANNGSAEADSVNTAAKKVADNMFDVPEGKKFTGWNTAADGTGTAYAPGAKLEGDLTLYAQWATVCYEAVYDLAGGVGTAEVTAATASIEEGKLIISDSKGTITLKPATGEKFKNGDIIELAGTVGNASKPFGIKIGSQTIQTEDVTPVDPAAPTAGGSAKVSAVLTLAADAESIAILRAGGTTTTLTSCVIKREAANCKEIISTVETLTNAKINNVALDPNFLSELIDTKSVEVLNAYATAPTVTFTKHVVITYDDESIKESNVDVEVVAEELGKDQWTAKFTLGDKTYSVTMQRATAYTVTYKLKDETVLGTEVVAAGTSPKEYAQYEVMPLAEFGGWYRESTLENAIDLANEVINADITVYAKFDKAYAQSINIEQWVLDNGKNNTAFKALLQERGYAYENINDLDSLNDDPSKANRNEPYLGLKIKKTGGYIAFNVLAGQSVAIKFGNADAAVKISVYGVDTTITPEAKALPDLKFTTEAETLVKIAATADKTVVIKQIMIDEPIADVVLPGKTQYVATCDSTVNGTISINGENSWKAYPGDTVVVTYQPAIGYQLDKITVDGKAITPEEGLYYFIMPAKNVTVSATFKEADPIVPPTRYAITIAEMQNGTVTADKEYASATELVTLTVTPAEGYKVADVKVNGVSLNPTNNTYSFEMPAEDVTITATFEPAQEATKYLVTIAELENGSIRFADLDNDDHKYYEGDLVHLIIIPAEGYKLVSANAGNEALQPDEDGNCSFRMPGQDVTVSATFEPESQGIEDANITKKAVKVIRDGQVLIIRDGKIFNALGAEVK